MKLLRLTTDNQQGLFDIKFNEEVDVEAKSKMALHSLSFEQLKRTIEIDSDNDEITVNYKTTSPAISRTKILTHNLYSPDNVDYLLENIQTLLNQTPLLENANQHGIEWKVEKGQKNKINIFYKKNPTLRKIANPKNNNVEYVTTNNGTYQPTGASGGYVASTDFLPRGCGYFRAKWYTRADGDLYIGVSQQNPDLNTGFSINNILYGVYVDRVAGQYKYILNGVLGGAVAVIGTNDWIETGIEDGKVVCNVYRDGEPAGNNLLSQEYNNITKLYPYLVFTGTQANSANISYNYSSFSNVNSSSNDTHNVGAVPMPTARNTASNQSVVLESIELAEYLGFENRNLGEQLTTEYYALAPELFLLNSYNDSFVVELLDLKLDSYDSQKGTRRNILAVIPSAEINEQSSAGIVYEANNLIWINLNNYEKLNLRNMRLRVLQRDLTPIEMKGLAVMTVLVKDKDE